MPKKHINLLLLEMISTFNTIDHHIVLDWDTGSVYNLCEGRTLRRNIEMGETGTKLKMQKQDE